MKILAIIPARGGSKGVKRKNLQKLHGKTLISLAYEQGVASGVFDKIVGSSEDEEILASFNSLGCETIVRPDELALDDTPMNLVIEHILNCFEKENLYFDYFFILQPTAPFRSYIDIRNCADLLKEKDHNSIVSLYKVEDHHPSRMYYIKEEKLIKVLEEPSSGLRQDLTPVYHRNGAIYCSSISAFRKEKKILSEPVYPYIMPLERSINIDTPVDLELARVLSEKKG
ncbi:cytidylyltransferase domain-containing protein [Ekhidna sp.]|uniref:acylneuraminate cytidylyltransferase family protein n=1 Tax=Ekhidna sp. TaxID=2608089 RepID=UPI003CCC3EAD